MKVGFIGLGMQTINGCECVYIYRHFTSDFIATNNLTQTAGNKRSRRIR